MIKNVHGNTVDLLGEAIVSGHYPAGTSLPPEPVLGESLGVSRTVVRESIKSLIAKGLITTGPKVGTRVQPEDQWNWFDPDVITWRSKAGITPEFLRDLQDLRRIVEPAAVRLAAQRATPADIADLEQAFAGMHHALHHGGDYVVHDLRFHQGLLRAAATASSTARCSGRECSGPSFLRVDSSKLVRSRALMARLMCSSRRLPAARSRPW